MEYYETLRPVDERVTEASNFSLGRMYDSLDTNVKHLLDTLIRGNKSKIAVIRFLVNHFNLSLTLGKILYEGREAFLNRLDDPFGW